MANEKNPRKHRQHPPATADRGATPENVARALLRPMAPPDPSLRKKGRDRE